MADNEHKFEISNCPAWKPDGRVGIAQVMDHGMQELINEQQEAIQAKSEGRDYSNLKGLSYRTQVQEGGANYYIKAQAKNGKQVHLKIHQSHPDLVTHLAAIQHDKSDADEIEAFD